MSTSLSPDHILKDVSQMWTSLGKQASTAEGGVLRACTLTLVVLAAPGEDAAVLGETLALLMPGHPARTIVIRLAGSGESSAAVTAQCWMPVGQHRQICCEQIEITAAEDHLDDVVSILGPIAAPDLPLVLWCRSHAAIETPAFRRLASLATRVIVDSAQWPDPKSAITQLAERGRALRIGDLSWTNLTRWREMLSQVFENRKYAEHIPEIARVHVNYRGAVPPVEAYYMAGWVTDSLDRAGARAELEMAGDQRTDMRELEAVELIDDHFTVNLSRLRETLVITADGVSRCIRLPPAKDHLLMSEELDVTRTDEVFQRTLAAASRL
jgi:glucose-6-phosphate dehydrogenase assembly protein OpcA